MCIGCTKPRLGLRSRSASVRSRWDLSMIFGASCHQLPEAWTYCACALFPRSARLARRSPVTSQFLCRLGGTLLVQEGVCPLEIEQAYTALLTAS